MHPLVLGIFVLTGVTVLILAFYLVGRNRNLFGGAFELKARFSNLNGLIAGDNVTYAGIQAGTVHTLTMVNDSMIEVSLLMNEDISRHIHRNAIASIGSEGLMGNKIVSIFPGKGDSPMVRPGDLLQTLPVVSTDEMLQTLSVSNRNIAALSGNLRSAVGQISQSHLVTLLNDPSLARDIRSTIHAVNGTAIGAKQFSETLSQVMQDVKAGKGVAGVLLADTAQAAAFRNTITDFEQTGKGLQQFSVNLNKLAVTANSKLGNDSPIGVLLNDSLSARHLRSSLQHIDSATWKLQQDLEALKHNFLFRGYFKAQEKADAKKAKATIAKP